VSYAAQLGPRKPLLDASLPLARQARRPGGPASAVHVDRAAGPDGLLLVLEATGALLAAMVRTRQPQVRAYHAYGISDPEGFAAMGITETLVHTHDVAQGLALSWVPPADVCSRVLNRLFPDAPAGADSWVTLLWATGRGELPGHPGSPPGTGTAQSGHNRPTASMTSREPSAAWCRPPFPAPVPSRPVFR
jgi:hypothetical protein